jgi:hypothetical protein
MIRFTWLQFRLQAIVAGSALVAIALVLAITGPHLVSLYDTTVIHCAAHGDCSAATTALINADGTIQVALTFLLLAVPALIGMFWGAPLIAKEFETGTYRLAWTQGVTRTRWLTTKLGVGVLAGLTVTGLLSLMVTWWSSPIDTVNAKFFDPLVFSTRDLTPVGYAVFAMMLGVTAGLLMRRTIPALFSTLAGFVAIRYVMNSLVRPHLMAPLHQVLAINARSPLDMGETPTGFQVTATTRGVLPGDWVYSNRIVDNAGRAPTTAFLHRACPLSHASAQVNYKTCANNLAARFHELVTYQPQSRYWTFQWYEMAIYMVLAIVLGGICLLWIRRPT